MTDYNERDKHMAAVHEAGHATVAAVLCWIHGRSQTIPLPETVPGMTHVESGVVWAEIRRTETSNPAYERTWSGSTSHGNMNLSELDQATICVAGIVAEHLDEEEDVCREWIIDFWEDQTIKPSDTDYAGIPDAWDVRSQAVDRALDLLRKHRKLYNAVVDELTQNEDITAGELEDLVKQHCC
jgi:hypothetical protein